MKSKNDIRLFKIAFNTLIVLISLHACIEEIEPEAINFSSALVVEATILNKMQSQTIFVNRSFNFSDEGPQPVSGAMVIIRDDGGNIYNFSESEPGVYISDIEFAAEEEIIYELEITTNNGNVYLSTPESLPAPTQIDELFAERLQIDGVDGMAIKVNGYNPSGESRNYRYIYEETYKIIAPKWSSRELIENERTEENPCDLRIIDEVEEERVCYRTDLSNSIIQFDTNNLDEDRVDEFIVRFIESDNYIISHRYTILVKQLVQSDVAYNYYQTLADFSGSENLFSETQPGFLVGNIEGVSENSENVLGFFEVASIDEKRIFFDYEDFYAGEPLPPYIVQCNEFAPPLSGSGGCILLRLVLRNEVKFVSENLEPAPAEGPYFVVFRPCGDCTALGSNVIPEFWVE